VCVCVSGGWFPRPLNALPVQIHVIFSKPTLNTKRSKLNQDQDRRPPVSWLFHSLVESKGTGRIFCVRKENKAHTKQITQKRPPVPSRFHSHFAFGEKTEHTRNK